MDAHGAPPGQPELPGLPPPILTSDPGSFAWRTFKHRIPAIVDDTISLNRFPDEVNRSLRELRQEIVAGKIRGLQEIAPDAGFWESVSLPFVGSTWLEVPWYWAEAFFYRRILEATHYFQPGPWFRFDPYRTKKMTEWQPAAAPRLVASALADLPSDRAGRFEALLHYSLWGNRTDLSYNVALSVGRPARPEDDRANLLIDDTSRIWQHLHAGMCRRLVLITDNAGTELLMDMALVDLLLAEHLVEQVVIHLKPQPFFVSDAMPADVEDALESLRGGGETTQALRARLSHYLQSGRLRLVSHWFYASSLFYFQMPEDLRASLAEASLVILKGDVNYRRVLGDALWPPTTPFDQATGYFPAPFANLRTLKGEIIVGLQEGQAERLGEQAADWMVNGRRGLIQARL